MIRTPALEGVRVLDLATFISAGFCGTILGEFGAEVIKVEQPRVGDPLRKFGTPTEAGDYRIVCNEFCGVGHHIMVGKVNVRPAGTASVAAPDETVAQGGDR